MYIYQKQCEILQKNSLKQLKRPISVISHWFSVEMVQRDQNYTNANAFSQIVKKFWGNQGMPSES